MTLEEIKKNAPEGATHYTSMLIMSRDCRCGFYAPYVTM